MLCPHCNSQLPEGLIMCFRCGRPLRGPAAQPGPAGAPPELAALPKNRKPLILTLIISLSVVLLAGGVFAAWTFGLFGKNSHSGPDDYLVSGAVSPSPSAQPDPSEDPSPGAGPEPGMTPAMVTGNFNEAVAILMMMDWCRTPEDYRTLGFTQNREELDFASGTGNDQYYDIWTADPQSSYFSDFEGRSILTSFLAGPETRLDECRYALDGFSEDEIIQIFKAAERYISSQPRMGHWEGRALFFGDDIEYPDYFTENQLLSALSSGEDFSAWYTIQTGEYQYFSAYLRHNGDRRTISLMRQKQLEPDEPEGMHLTVYDLPFVEIIADPYIPGRAEVTLRGFWIPDEVHINWPETEPGGIDVNFSVLLSSNGDAIYEIYTAHWAEYGSVIPASLYELETGMWFYSMYSASSDPLYVDAAVVSVTEDSITWEIVLPDHPDIDLHNLTDIGYQIDVDCYYYYVSGSYSYNYGTWQDNGMDIFNALDSYTEEETL